MRVRVYEERPWYDKFDKKWHAWRFQTPPEENPLDVLDERLALHLMMADVFSKGQLFPALQRMNNVEDQMFEWAEYGQEQESAWNLLLQYFKFCDASPSADLDKFFYNLSPERIITAEGGLTLQQLDIWLKLYSGLNGINKA
jgi:hypothetical protein